MARTDCRTFISRLKGRKAFGLSGVGGWDQTGRESIFGFVGRS